MNFSRHDEIFCRDEIFLGAGLEQGDFGGKPIFALLPAWPKNRVPKPVFRCVSWEKEEIKIGVIRSDWILNLKIQVY